jgi:hypothetical protein
MSKIFTKIFKIIGGKLGVQYLKMAAGEGFPENHYI